MNTPNHASDTAINELAELEHEQVYLRSPPAQDWRLDLDDDGVLLGTCPCCAYRGALLSAPDERVQCCECGHVDGTKYKTVGHGPFEPSESVELPRDYSDED